MPEQAPEASGPAGPAGSYARWAAVLDELEAELARASAPRTGDAAERAAAWTAPRDLGPIPAELVDRATALAAAQQETILALRSRARANRQQSAYLEAVPKAAGTAAVYLDVRG